MCALRVHVAQLGSLMCSVFECMTCVPFGVHVAQLGSLMCNVFECMTCVPFEVHLAQLGSLMCSVFECMTCVPFRVHVAQLGSLMCSVFECMTCVPAVFSLHSLPLCDIADGFGRQVQPGGDTSSSLFMKELQEFVSRSYADYLFQFHCSDFIMDKLVLCFVSNGVVFLKHTFFMIWVCKDRHHCFKSDNIPKTEGGPINLIFVTVL